MARWQDRPAVLHAGPNDLGSQTTALGEMELKLVCPCAGMQPVRGHLTSGARVGSRHADRLCSCVFDAIHFGTVGARKPIVSDDSVHCRCRACGNAGVAGTGIGRRVTEVVVHAHKPFVEEALESPFTKAAVVTREVIRPHLVDGDGHHDFGRGVLSRDALRKLGNQRIGGGAIPKADHQQGEDGKGELG